MENKHRKEIFCRCIHKNGRTIYPKNAKFFHFWVDEVTSDDNDLDLSASSDDVTDD